MLLPSELLELHLGHPLLLLLESGLELILLGLLVHEFLLAPLTLVLHESSLFRFLLFVKLDGVLDFLLLLSALVLHPLETLTMLVLPLLLCSYLFHFLLDSFLISILEPDDIACSALGLLNFLPGFHLLLLQEGNPIRQQLGVSLDATIKT